MVAETIELRASSRAMTSRTTKLRAAIAPHLDLFSADFRKSVSELLKLAEVGERAQAFVASFVGDASATGPRGAAKRTKAASKPKTAKQSGGASPRAPKASSLRAAVLDVLRTAGKPLPLAEIESGVKTKGHSSKSANFAKILSLTIGKMKTELRRVDRGVYALV